MSDCIKQQVNDINRYVSSLRWMDFEIREVVPFHPQERSFQLKIVGGENLDLDYCERIEIIFHDVSFLMAQILIRYSTSAEKEFIKIVERSTIKSITHYDFDEDEYLFELSVDDAEYIYIGASTLTHHVL